MCGLVGIAGKLAFREEKTMRYLLLLDSERGMDSTGFASVRKDGDCKVAKIASHPFDLFDLTRFKAAMTASQSLALMGHNRAATRGAVRTSNAHPFEFGDIVGMHNGTLDAASTKALEELAGESFAVDSMAIFAAFAKVGVAKTIAAMREGYTSSDGAWSLVWYDRSDRSLNFLRNKHRPMWYAFNKERNQLFWASEWQFIDAACRRSSDKYELFVDPKTHYTYRTTEENVHYKFDLAALEANKDKVFKPVCKPIKGKEALASAGGDPFSRNSVNGSSSSGGSSQSMGPNTTIRSPSTMTTICPSSSSRVKINKPVTMFPMVGDKEHPLAGYYSKTQFEAMVESFGCQWCKTPIEWGTKGITIYEKDSVVLCPECSSGNPEMSRIYAPDIAALLV